MKRLILLFAILLLTLPVACHKGLGIPTTPPVPTLTPVNTVGSVTATFTPTNTPITNTPTFTPTGSYTPIPTNTFTPGPTLTNFSLSSGVTTLAAGTYHFGAVTISGSAVVTLGGPVTIFATSFDLGAGASIRGLGYWDTNYREVVDHGDKNYSVANGLAIPIWPGAGPGSPLGTGPGNGEVNDLGGGGVGEDYTSGGGGHGGAGGSGYNPTCEVAVGGGSNDDPIHPVLMGSGGGTPPGSSEISAPAGWGGGLIWIVVYDPISNKVAPATIDGTIDMDGFGGCGICGTDYESGAGGAGGAILVEASTITGSGLLSANGGNGLYGLGPEGNGGGGIISLIEGLTSFSGTTSVLAGAGSTGSGCSVNSKGGVGIVTFTAAPSSGY